MKKQKTTIYEIAQALNMSPSTVSRALRNDPRISAATKRAVSKLAQDLNYQPNHIAAALRNGRSKILGIIVPNIDRSFFSSVVFGIEQVANKEGFNVMICQSHEDYNKEVETVDALMNAQVDGVIVSFAKTTTDFNHFKRVIQMGIPLILFDRTHEDIVASNVVTDDFNGAYKAVEHLIVQGCNRIAHFTGMGAVGIYRERFRGYREALIHHNIPFDPTLVIASDVQVADGQEIMQKLIIDQRDVDGVFSASAFAAMGALKICKRNKIAVPDQVSIVGFSNELFSSFSDPTLTTVDQNSLLMGNVAAEMFFNQLKNPKTNQEFIPRKTVLTPTLMIRESSSRNVLVGS
jgi:LacI family transcriptional regulator